mgnify:FL=1
MVSETTASQYAVDSTPSAPMMLDIAMSRMAGLATNLGLQALVATCLRPASA